MDSLLEIAAARIADPSFVGMTKSVGDDKERRGMTRGAFVMLRNEASERHAQK